MRYTTPMKPEDIPAVTLPLERCMYCWYILHPTLTFPRTWSSTCCNEHHAWMLARSAHSKATRSSARASSENLGVALSMAQRMMEGHP